MSRKRDLVAVGQPLVDATIDVRSETLQSLGLVGGSSELVNSDVRAAFAFSVVANAPARTPGGSAAVTAMVLAELSGTGAFVGSVGTDMAGSDWIAAVEGAGVQTFVARKRTHTGLCLVMRAAETERSMLTSPGASIELTSDDLPADVIEEAQTLLVGAYLLANDGLRDVLRVCMERAQRSQTKVCFTLASESCVREHREAILELMRIGHVDVWIGNEAEWQALYFPDVQTGATRRAALAAAASHSVNAGVITLGKEGSLALDDGAVEQLAAPIVNVVDDVGAGDGFAAGLLLGLAADRSLLECCAFGNAGAVHSLTRVGGSAPPIVTGRSHVVFEKGTLT